jgi:hypothetical protein
VFCPLHKFTEAMQMAVMCSIMPGVKTLVQTQSPKALCNKVASFMAGVASSGRQVAGALLWSVYSRSRLGDRFPSLKNRIASGSGSEVYLNQECEPSTHSGFKIIICVQKPED